MYYLLLLAILISCNGNKSKTETNESILEPIQWLTLKGNPDMPNIILISGDEEYRSEEALPQLAKILSTRHGFNCTVLFAQDPEKPGIINANYLNNIPGLEKLESADLMIMFTRFRALPDEQMQRIDNYLKSGKPVLGIRTATHAFNFSDIDFESKWLHYGNYYEGDDEWKGGFGRLVLGEKWIVHHGHHKHQSTRGVAAPDQQNHPILKGISEGDIWGPTDVYGVRLPLPGDAQAVVLGQVVNRAGEYNEKDPLYGMKSTDTEVATTKIDKDDQGNEIEVALNEPMMPIVWTKSYQIPDGKPGKAFATTIGSSTDLLSEGTRRMMVNGVFWLLDKNVPEKANVDIVGTYDPTAYAFLEEDHWLKKNQSISSLKE